MNRDDFEPIGRAREETLLARVASAPFSTLLGLRLEEVRRDYARMRLPFRKDLTQLAGLIHGGAVATLVDSVVVGAILSGLDGPPQQLLTINMHIQYLDRVGEEDLVAEARVRRRGRRIVFLEVEVKTAAGRDVAHGEIVYRVSP